MKKKPYLSFDIFKCTQIDHWMCEISRNAIKCWSINVYGYHTCVCGCACYVQIYPSIYLFILLSIHILWMYTMYFYVDKRSNHCACRFGSSFFLFVWHQRFSIITNTHSKIKSKQFLHGFDVSKGQYACYIYIILLKMLNLLKN